MSELIRFPLRGADAPTVSFSATLNETITDAFTILAVTVTAAITDFSLTNAAGILVGARVKVDITQDATGRNVTFGSSGDDIVAPVLTGVLNDRDTIELVWDGTAWVGGVWEKVVDAA